MTQRYRLAILVALGLTIATHAEAQSLKPAIVAYSAAAGLDWASTSYAIHQGGHEADPLVNWAGSRQTAHVLAVGIALDAAVLLVTTKLVAPHHPKLAASFLYLAAGFRLPEVGHNVYVGQHPVLGR